MSALTWNAANLTEGLHAIPMFPFWKDHNIWHPHTLAGKGLNAKAKRKVHEAERWDCKGSVEQHISTKYHKSSAYKQLPSSILKFHLMGSAD